MERADFIHLVRLSENASSENSQSYRRGVAAFAALGYLWVIGCFVVAAAILYWTAGSLTQGRFKVAYLGLVLAAGGLLLTSLRALWCRLEAPQGVELQPADAPALFAALARIRKKIKGPPIHKVLLDANFNASITQLPRFGLFGGAVNYLTIGLPLLMAVDSPRFLAVLTHEYGHLRSNHGRFAAWIYRTRMSWARLGHSMRHDEGPAAAATQVFLRWYFPRFLARTFALARQDEYEADKIAAKLLGRAITGAALTEIAVKGVWIAREFWSDHWRAALANPLPVGPYTSMRKLLALELPDDFSRDALRDILRKISDVDDTHPVLRDRLDALEVSKNLPAWSARPALGLLGTQSTKWMAHFDRQWCRDNATNWKQHHAYLVRVRQRVEILSASIGSRSADEITALGDLRKRLDPRANVRSHYERALTLSPGHGGALRGLVQSLPDVEHETRIDYLNQLFESSVANRWWACRTAVDGLEKPAADGYMDTTALKLWRARLKQAEESEARAREELSGTPYFQSISRHDLNEFELGEFQSGMARCKPAARAWLVRKELREFAYRRCYLLFVDLPQLDDDERYDLCRELERWLDLPGPMLALWAGHSPTLVDIHRNAFDPVFVRAVD